MIAGVIKKIMLMKTLCHLKILYQILSIFIISVILTFSKSSLRPTGSRKDEELITTVKIFGDSSPGEFPATLSFVYLLMTAGAMEGMRTLWTESRVFPRRSKGGRCCSYF